MAVALRGTAQAGDGTTATGATTAVATIPSAAQIGDLALMFLTENVNAPTYTPPSGWSAVTTQNIITSNQSTQIFGKILASGEPGSSASFSTNNNGRFIGLMAVYSGADTNLANIVSAYAGPQAQTSFTTPTVTTSVANCMIINFLSARAASTTAANLTMNSPQAIDASTRSAYTTSPNFTESVSHSATLSGAAGSYGGATGSSDQSVNIAMYTLAIPPNPVTYNTGQFFPFM